MLTSGGSADMAYTLNPDTYTRIQGQAAGAPRPKP